MKKMIFICMGLVMTALLFAQSPEAFNYQAVVRDATGAVKANQDVRFRISILQGIGDGSTTVYQETYSVKTNEFGLVNLVIGKGTNQSVGMGSIDWGGHSHFLKVEIDPAGGTNYVLMGTTQLLSVPYALYSQSSGSSIWSQNDSNIFFNKGNVGIGFNAPLSKLHVYNLEGFRQIAANEWADMSSCGAGIGLFATNAYLNNTDNTIRYSLTHDDLGAAGILFNSPTWNSAGIFVNTSTVGSVKDQSFEPNFIATFKPGEINANSNKITHVADPVEAQDVATKAYVDQLLSQLKKADTIMDARGNVYTTVKIGNQIWMRENLKTEVYNDGAQIPYVEDSQQWATLTTHACCTYANGGEMAAYGFFYNWYAVNTGKLCPVGWHIPSDAEWTSLTTLLGGESDAGGKMKTIYGWGGRYSGATNESGFSATPGGFRNSYGYIHSYGITGYWWSSTETSAMDAWIRSLDSSINRVEKSSAGKNLGISVRCVKD